MLILSSLSSLWWHMKCIDIWCLFFIKKCHKIYGPPLCHLGQWLIFYWPKFFFQALISGTVNAVCLEEKQTNTNFLSFYFDLKRDQIHDLPHFRRGTNHNTTVVVQFLVLNHFICHHKELKELKISILNY
jgi:hypothetical protein